MDILVTNTQFSNKHTCLSVSMSSLAFIQAKAPKTKMLLKNNVFISGRFVSKFLTLTSL